MKYDFDLFRDILLFIEKITLDKSLSTDLIRANSIGGVLNEKVGGKRFNYAFNEHIDSEIECNVLQDHMKYLFELHLFTISPLEISAILGNGFLDIIRNDDEWRRIKEFGIKNALGDLKRCVYTYDEKKHYEIVQQEYTEALQRHSQAMSDFVLYQSRPHA